MHCTAACNLYGCMPRHKSRAVLPCCFGRPVCRRLPSPCGWADAWYWVVCLCAATVRGNSCVVHAPAAALAAADPLHQRCLSDTSLCARRLPGCMLAGGPGAAAAAQCLPSTQCGTKGAWPCHACQARVPVTPRPQHTQLWRFSSLFEGFFGGPSAPGPSAAFDPP